MTHGDGTSAGAARTGISPSPPTTEPPGRALTWVDLACAAGLAALIAVLAAGELDPPSLWLDDAWQALVARAGSLGEAVRTTVSYPGYVLVLTGVLRFTGPSELAAQLPAFIAGCAVPAAFVIVMARRGLSTAAALLGGAVLATSPVLVTFAARVKHFTLDALLAVVLLGLAWWVVEAPGDRRRWAALALTAVLATAASAGVAPLAAAGLLAGMVAAVRTRAGHVSAAVATVTYLAAALSWRTFFVEPRTTGALRLYWRDDFLDWREGPVELARQGAEALARVAQSLSAAPTELVALAVLAGTVAATLRRLELGVLVAAPVAGALLAATLELAPVGTGRTDSYLLPALALAIAFGAEEVVRSRRRGDRWATMIGPWGPIGAVVVMTTGLAAAAGRVDTSYPQQDLRPLVSIVEDEAEADEPIRLHPLSQWAYALYSAHQVDLVDDREQLSGFRPLFSDDRVEVFEPQREHPERYAAQVEEWTADARPFWLVASHVGDDVVHLRTLLGRAGWEVTFRETREDALVERWELAA